MRSGGGIEEVVVVSNVPAADIVGMESGTMGRKGGEPDKGLDGAVLVRESCLLAKLRSISGA
jgi:hypothetical protein